MKNLLTIIFFTCCNSAFGQTAGDSATYWVNSEYLDCLDSGKSICHCQEKNNFVMLKIHAKKNKCTLVPSVYASPTSFEFDLKKQRSNKNELMVLPGAGLDSGTVILFQDTLLLVRNSKQSLAFMNTTIGKSNSSDDVAMRDHIALLNCKPLLKYSTKPCNGTTLLLPAEELVRFILNGQISIQCAGEAHYNEMLIKNSDVDYFLTYDAKTIKLFKQPKKSRDQSIDISSLSECQVFYKNKKE